MASKICQEMMFILNGVPYTGHTLWVKMYCFNLFAFSRPEEQTSMTNHGVEGSLSVVSADVIKELDEKICLHSNFTIYQLSEHFRNLSGTVLYHTFTEKLVCWKFWAQWVPTMFWIMRSLTNAKLKKYMFNVFASRIFIPP